MTRTIVVTGAGGVGKTTVAAAIATRAADTGAATLVLTVDPARRLATALGLAHLSNEPSEVPGAPALSAAMLDVTASWEAIIRRHADPEVAERLLANRYFRAIADRFPAAQAYAAGEQMVEYQEDGRWDLIVIDTPPSAGGMDFFTAPAQMSEMVGGKLLAWITGARLPGRRTLYRLTARPVLRFADVVLGGPLLEDIAEFLLDMSTTYDGLSARAGVIERSMRRATILVVTTADPAPLREARRFYEELGAASVRPTAVVFNRSLPLEWASAGSKLGAVDVAAGALLRDNLRRWGGEAQRQADARADFAARYRTVMASIPWFADAPTTLDDLRALIGSVEGLPAEVLGA